MKDYDTHTFLKILKEEKIHHYYEDEWLIVDGDGFGNVLLGGNKGYVGNTKHELTTLPNKIKFNNKGFVNLSGNYLRSLPNGIEFNNGGYVSFKYNYLSSLPSSIKFNNTNNVYLDNNYITFLPEGIKFNNSGSLVLSYNGLTSLPDDIEFNCSYIQLHSNYLISIPDSLDLFYDKLDNETKEYIKWKFPDHWYFDKERFGL